MNVEHCREHLQGSLVGEKKVANDYEDHVAKIMRSAKFGEFDIKQTFISQGNCKILHHEVRHVMSIFLWVQFDSECYQPHNMREMVHNGDVVCFVWMEVA